MAVKLTEELTQKGLDKINIKRPSNKVVDVPVGVFTGEVEASKEHNEQFDNIAKSMMRALKQIPNS